MEVGSYPGRAVELGGNGLRSGQLAAWGRPRSRGSGPRSTGQSLASQTGRRALTIAYAAGRAGGAGRSIEKSRLRGLS